MSIEHTIPLSSEFFKTPYNYIRRAKLILFESSLINNEDFQSKSYDEQMSLLKKMERSCYNYTISKANDANIITSWEVELFCDLYHSICYKLSSNLDSTLVNNPNFANLVVSDKLSISNLPKLSSQEMFPEKYIEIMKRVEASKNTSITVKTTAMYKCRKCHQNMCTYENVYNRSLDEGVSLRITCLNCGFAWGG